MSITITSKYLGNLRTQAEHVKSGKTLITDAPIDNQGKGETFSPTDLFAASISSCMLTIMGIAARNHKLNIENTLCNVTKIMSSNPRRISEIIIEINFPENNFDDQQKQILKEAALNCPVALSLNPDLKKIVSFNF